MQIRNLVLLLAALALTTGCTTTRKVAGPKPKLRVVEKETHTRFEPADHTVFVSKLNQMLFTEEPPFQPGSDFTLTWEPVKIDRGSRALRYLVGFGAGRAEVIVRGSITDARGRVVATGEGKGTQTAGLMGGSFGSAVEECAEELVEWAAGVPFQEKPVGAR